MRYFIAIFCSPLALLLALKPFAAVLNAFLYIAAFPGWLFFGVPGFVLWGLGVMHAWIVISQSKADARAERVQRSVSRRPF